MTVAASNIIGLLLSLAGVILLFRYGMPYRLRARGGEIITTRPTEENQRAESQANVLGNTGLAFIVIGTGCQIVANLVAGP